MAIIAGVINDWCPPPIRYECNSHVWYCITIVTIHIMCHTLKPKNSSLYAYNQILFLLYLRKLLKVVVSIGTYMYHKKFETVKCVSRNDFYCTTKGLLSLNLTASTTKHLLIENVSSYNNVSYRKNVSYSNNVS